jgi:hypothetical protein
MAFPVPLVADNPDGWGPSSVPERLTDIPFSFFSKGDKLGRVADWSLNTHNKFGGAWAAKRGGGGPAAPLEISCHRCPCRARLPARRPAGVHLLRQ